MFFVDVYDEFVRFELACRYSSFHVFPPDARR